MEIELYLILTSQFSLRSGLLVAEREDLLDRWVLTHDGSAWLHICLLLLEREHRLYLLRLATLNLTRVYLISCLEALFLEGCQLRVHAFLLALVLGFAVLNFHCGPDILSIFGEALDHSGGANATPELLYGVLLLHLGPLVVATGLCTFSTHRLEIATKHREYVLLLSLGEQVVLTMPSWRYRGIVGAFAGLARVRFHRGIALICRSQFLEGLVWSEYLLLLLVLREGLRGVRAWC